MRTLLLAQARIKPSTLTWGSPRIDRGRSPDNGRCCVGGLVRAGREGREEDVGVEEELDSTSEEGRAGGEVMEGGE